MSIINHNIAALNTHRQLNFNNTNVSKSLEKLSSGFRINRAGDDAAGLAISEKMRGQIRGLDMASRNAQDGISLIQTAEGALNETHSILQRMRELAVQASNDTNTAADRDEIQKEVNQLTSEINRIGNSTEFNKMKLLDGKLNSTAESAANVKGIAVGNSVAIHATETSGAATAGAAGLATADFQAATGAGVAGSVTYTGVVGPTVGAGNNELTLTVDNKQVTVVIPTDTYDGAAGPPANPDLDNLTQIMQGVINTALGGGAGDPSVTVSTNADGQIQINTNSAAGSVTLDGGGFMATHIGTPGAVAATPANNTLVINVDGAEQTITLSGAYDLTDAVGGAGDEGQVDFLTDLNAQLTGATASFVDGRLVITSDSEGAGSSVEIAGGSALAQLGLTTSTAVAGSDINNAASVTIDGETIAINLTTGTWSGATLANELQRQINESGQLENDATVSFADGKFTITSGSEGSTGTVAITAGALADALGLGTGAVTTAGADETNNDLQFQIGANTGQFMSVSIGDTRADALGISSATASATVTVKDAQGNDVEASFKATSEVTNGTNNQNVEYALDLSSSNKASAAIAVIDAASSSISNVRSKLGAYQNRLEHTINNLGTASENLTAAESRIRDVDMAKEMMEFTKNNILTQAAQAMLAQANQQPQGVLQLLR